MKEIGRHILQVIKMTKLVKYNLRNQNERNRETYTSSNKNEIIWETDTSSNLIARTEEKNIGNKQGSLHKNEGKMELNGLSLMLLLLINQ